MVFHKRTIRAFKEGDLILNFDRIRASATDFIRSNPITTGAIALGVPASFLGIAFVGRRVAKRKKKKKAKKKTTRKRTRKTTKAKRRKRKHTHKSPRHKGHKVVSFRTKSGKMVRFKVKKTGHRK